PVPGGAGVEEGAGVAVVAAVAVGDRLALAGPGRRVADGDVTGGLGQAVAQGDGGEVDAALAADATHLARARIAVVELGAVGVDRAAALRDEAAALAGAVAGVVGRAHVAVVARRARLRGVGTHAALAGVDRARVAVVAVNGIARGATLLQSCVADV